MHIDLASPKVGECIEICDTPSSDPERETWRPTTITEPGTRFGEDGHLYLTIELDDVDVERAGFSNGIRRDRYSSPRLLRHIGHRALASRPDRRQAPRDSDHDHLWRTGGGLRARQRTLHQPWTTPCSS